MAKQAKAQKAIQKKTTNAVANLENRFFEDQGEGAEDTTSEDYAIPFLVILQDMSPQVKKRDPAYIDGAEAGNILDTVTGRLYESVDVVPCAYMRRILEWRPRDSGGGLVGQHDYDRAFLEQHRQEDGKVVNEAGNVLRDTAHHYVLYEDDEGQWQQAVVTMSSTQLKHSKRWMSMRANIKAKGPEGQVYNPPHFSRTYRLGTEAESNEKGEWFGWHVELIGPVEEAFVYETAKIFHDSIRAGKIKTQDPEQPAEAGEGDIPF